MPSLILPVGWMALAFLPGMAPDIDTAVLRFDPFEIQRSELLRFRRSLCTAWEERRTQNIKITFTSVDASWGSELRIEPGAPTGMVVTVIDTTSSLVPSWDEEGPTFERHKDVTRQTYDTLEFVMPDGSSVPAGTTVSCEAIAEGRFIPQLRWRKTGRTIKW